MTTWGPTKAGTRPVVRDGSTVATLSPAAQRDDAQVEIGGARWLFYAARGALWAERSGAEKPTLQAVRKGRRSWRIQTADVAYDVERSGARRYVVRRDGSEIGTASGGRPARAAVEISIGIPVEHEVFLLWLVGAKHRGAKHTAGPGASTMGPSPSAFDGGFAAGGGM
ncbi:hypothetical protein [Solicola gregarius]|uniref:Uncharacterized protein n=1 Tax=Solicola gregarius TaxID=2908642 RepID=A0AA46TFB2_9ACTN|nr:hypothetical protein [Solicola gregarius]UYM03814.1 hypothetical protein L0C25_14830 [Solicola gregarius]